MRDVTAQQARLEPVLRFVYGESLSRGQIRDLFTEPGVRPTPALEAVVAQLAFSLAAEPLVTQLAADARTRQADNDNRAARDAGGA